MTYRERRERRAERRDEWANKRRVKANAAGNRALEMSQIMQGEPIKVGHHSEGRHRRDANRMDNLMHTAAESSQMARRHSGAADTIRQQLDSSIYRDDVDELEQLEAKLSEQIGRRDRMKAINVWLRKHSGIKRSGPRPLVGDLFDKAGEAIKSCADALALSRDEATDLVSALRYNAHLGYPAYALSNLSGNIGRTRKRADESKARRRVREALKDDSGT